MTSASRFASSGPHVDGCLFIFSAHVVNAFTNSLRSDGTRKSNKSCGRAHASSLHWTFFAHATRGWFSMACTGGFFMKYAILLSLVGMAAFVGGCSDGPTDGKG